MSVPRFATCSTLSGFLTTTSVSILVWAMHALPWEMSGGRIIRAHMVGDVRLWDHSVLNWRKSSRALTMVHEKDFLVWFLLLLQISGLHRPPWAPTGVPWHKRVQTGPVLLILRQIVSQ